MDKISKILVTIFGFLLMVALVAAGVSILDTGITSSGGYRQTALDLTGGRYLVYLRAYNSTSRPSLEWIASTGLPMANVQCHERADDYSTHNHCTWYTANGTGVSNSTLIGRLSIGYGTNAAHVDIKNAAIDMNGGNICMDADCDYYIDNNNGMRFYTQSDEVFRFSPNNTQTLYIENGRVDVDGDLYVNATATNKLRLPQQNTAGNPTLSFGNGNTGIYEYSDDVLRFSLGGDARWHVSTTLFGSSLSDGGALLYQSPSSTAPTLLPSKNDVNTGIGAPNADNISIIAGGVEMMRGIESATGLDSVYFPVSVGIGVVPPGSELHVEGETNISGISTDGTNKVVCIKSDGNLGTCSNLVENASGLCPCA